MISLLVINKSMISFKIMSINGLIVIAYKSNIKDIMSEIREKSTHFVTPGESLEVVSLPSYVLWYMC